MSLWKQTLCLRSELVQRGWLALAAADALLLYQAVALQGGQVRPDRVVRQPHRRRKLVDRVASAAQQNHDLAARTGEEAGFEAAHETWIVPFMFWVCRVQT